MSIKSIIEPIKQTQVRAEISSEAFQELVMLPFLNLLLETTCFPPVVDYYKLAFFTKKAWLEKVDLVDRFLFLEKLYNSFIIFWVI